MGQPILKWAGGKHQLLSEIISLFPDNYSELSYHEPFLGARASLKQEHAYVRARNMKEKKKKG